ncbi:MAG: DUF3105 domain-containing protein [Dehalococcoidia bacterium]|nr:DUF3105 domain-containing protein [Dehalococcoidia bacterium]
MFRFRLRHPRLFVATFAILAAAAVVVFLLKSSGDSRPDYPYSVQTFKDQGREHLPVGQPYDFYNSDPPTSGPHSSQPADWGVHDEPVAKEMQVHNLEHGGVAVLYDCSAGVPLDEAKCRELREQLAVIVQSDISARKLVLMAPYAGMEHRIALTAWGTLDTLDEFDAARIQAFITHYERKFNPEGF